MLEFCSIQVKHDLNVFINTDDTDIVIAYSVFRNGQCLGPFWVG